MDTEKEIRVIKRYQALYLFLPGKTCEETAEIVIDIFMFISYPHFIAF